MKVVDYKIVESGSEFWVYKVENGMLLQLANPFSSLQEANNWILMFDSPEGSYMMS